MGGPRPWGPLKSSKIDEISRVRGQEDSKLTAEVSRIDWERYLSMKCKFQIEKVEKTEVQKINFIENTTFGGIEPNVPRLERIRYRSAQISGRLA